MESVTGVVVSVMGGCGMNDRVCKVVDGCVCDGAFVGSVMGESVG